MAYKLLFQEKITSGNIFRLLLKNQTKDYNEQDASSYEILLPPDEEIQTIYVSILGMLCFSIFGVMLEHLDLCVMVIYSN